MKYINDYKRFIIESKKEIDKNGKILESETLGDLSRNFWDLCIYSVVFSDDEKRFIKENLINYQVDLVKEEWEWMNKTIEWASKKGQKFIEIINNKISYIRKGISSFVQSIINLAKNLLVSIIKAGMSAYKDFYNKQKESIKKEFTKLDKEESKTEFNQLTESLKHWGVIALESGKNTMTSSLKFGDELVKNLEGKLSTKEGEISKEINTNLAQAQKEIEQSQESVEEDLLIKFYEYGKINEKSEEKKSLKSTVIDFLLSFLGQEKLDPEVSTGKKVLWWGKLVLKILSSALSPLLKSIEFAIKIGSKAILQTFSAVTKWMGGPGFYKFVLLSGLVAGIVGLVTDSALLYSKLSGGETFLGKSEKDLSSVKKWIAGVLQHSSEYMPGAKTIVIIFTSFCLAMTLWHVGEELSHLSHAGDENH